MTRFRPGRRVRSLVALVQAIEAGRWVYAFGPMRRPIHPAFMNSLRLHTLKGLVGRARFAIERKDK